MTDQELQQLAREYAKSICSRQPMKANAIPEVWEKTMADTEKWLAELYKPLIDFISFRYCIVEKSKVKESYREHKESYDRLCKSQWDETPYQCEEQGAMDELESLFGKELFNNIEQ